MIDDLIKFKQIRGVSGYMTNKLKEFSLLRDNAMLGGGPEAIEKQHSAGKLTARERLEKLFDKDSFVEIDAFVKASKFQPGTDENYALGDGIVVGYGSINGRLVYAAAQDFTYAAGAVGEMHARKFVKVLDMAVKTGAPFISILDSNGARIHEGLDPLEGYGKIFSGLVRASGLIPLLSVIMGPCVGAASFIPSVSDFVFMIESMSFSFVNGSQVVSSVSGEDLSQQDLGGAQVHAEKSGLAHFVFNNEINCLNKIRELIGLLPDNNLSGAPRAESHDSINRLINELNNYDEKADVRMLISKVADEGSFLEIQKEFAPGIIIGFIRINGSTVGVIANQPAVNEGRIDSASASKAARFIRFCDAFNIPIVTFTNTTGFVIDPEEERNGLSRHASKLVYAFSEATVPKVNIIVGKAYGSAYLAMNSKHLGADLVFAWPASDISIMSAEAASGILFREMILSSDDPVRTRAEKTEEYRKKYANPYAAAARGYVDDIFEPAETRIRLISALDMLAAKREKALPKKHGNIPL